MPPERGPAGDPLREAAEWFATLNDGPRDAADRERWQRWLAAHPDHAAAWQRVERLSAEVDRLSPAVDKRAARLAFGAVDRSRRRRHLKLLGGLATVGTLGWLGLREEPWQHWSADHSTGVGERLQARLPDGGTVWLNTGSAVRLAFDGQRRRVELLRGELHVQTAADPQQPARPFLVESAEGWIHPEGTSFSVYRHDGECEVSVFAGSARVQPRGLPSGHPVAAGRQLSFQAGSLGRGGPAELRRQAWTRGLLVADDLRLQALAAELARHQRGYLACAPEVAELRVVGTYPLDDPERIWQALERSLPVRVFRPMPWWVRIEAA